VPFIKLTRKISNIYRLPLLVLTTLVIVLFFGLYPKKWTSTNNIQRLSEPNSLNFRFPSMAYVTDLSSLFNSQNLNEFTIQLPVVPANIDKHGFRPILMIHNGDDRHQLTVWQWGTSVIVMNGNDYDYSMRSPRISWEDALTAGEESLITITSSKRGSHLFINGQLVKEAQNLKLTIPNAHKKLRLILGNSVYGKHSWEGAIYGLLLNSQALSTEKVTYYYKQWIHQRDLSCNSSDGPMLLYTFNEYENTRIQDDTGHNQPLELPERLVILKKTFLSFSWHQFRPNLSFLFDAVINLIGFIPVGAVMCYWSSQSRSLPRKFEVKLILAFCFFLSLSIEIIQVWLPYRHSSILDLTLNTLGAWLGILLFQMLNTSLKNKSTARNKEEGGTRVS